MWRQTEDTAASGVHEACLEFIQCVGLQVVDDELNVRSGGFLGVAAGCNSDIE